MKEEKWVYIERYDKKYKFFDDGRIVIAATGKELKWKKVGNSESTNLFDGTAYKGYTKSLLLKKYFNIELGERNVIEDLPGEEWKDMVNYEGRYKVSSHGRVKSINLPYVGESLIKQKLNKKGSPTVCIMNELKKGYYTVSNLMARAFIANPQNYKMVVHLNGIKTDNRLENLKWVHNREAQNLAISLGLKTSVVGEENPCSIEVDQYSADGVTFIKRWGCINDIERELKIWHNNVSKVCKGKRATAGGYSWKYVEEE